jgi:hypothetical protein
MPLTPTILRLRALEPGPFPQRVSPPEETADGRALGRTFKCSGEPTGRRDRHGLCHPTTCGKIEVRAPLPVARRRGCDFHPCQYATSVQCCLPRNLPRKPAKLRCRRFCRSFPPNFPAVPLLASIGRSDASYASGERSGGFRLKVLPMRAANRARMVVKALKGSGGAYPRTPARLFGAARAEPGSRGSSLLGATTPDGPRQGARLGPARPRPAGTRSTRSLSTAPQRLRLGPPGGWLARFVVTTARRRDRRRRLVRLRRPHPTRLVRLLIVKSQCKFSIATYGQRDILASWEFVPVLTAEGRRACSTHTCSSVSVVSPWRGIPCSSWR